MSKQPSFSRKKKTSIVSSSSNAKKYVTQKVKIPLKGFVLDHLIHLFFTNNLKSSVSLLGAVKTFVNLVDESSYDEDHTKTLKFKLISALCDGYSQGFRLSQLLDYVAQGSDLEEKEDIICDILDAEFNDNDELIIHDEMSNEDINYIASFLAQRIQYAYLYGHKDSLEDRLHALRTDDFESLEDFNTDFSSELATLNRSIQLAKAATDTNNADFSLSKSSLTSIIEKTITLRKNKSSSIKTGIAGLNTMLGGGFQSGRVYMFLGPTGGWKSGLLVNVAKWYKDYNPDIVANDPTKTPCAIYLTLENDQLETLERIYATVVPVDEQLDFSDAETADIVDQFTEAGWCIDEDDNQEDIGQASNIKFSYKPSMSLDTSGLEAMIEDLAVNGFEVKLLVVDYIKRIRSINHTGDPYIDLGSIADEFSNIAKKYLIPVVTASQLNRKAIELIEEETEKSSGSASKKIGLQHVGESQKMLENLDDVYIINRQKRKSCGTLYLGIKSVKKRGKASLLSFIAQPFEENSEMCLIEDVNLAKPVYIEDITDGTSEGGEETRSSTQATTTKRRTLNRRSLPKTVDTDIDEL